MGTSLENINSCPSEEEPKLKYCRLDNDVKNIFLKDAVSCIRVHTKFICLGTKWGIIHLLDHEGNTVPFTTNTGKKSKELRAHSLAVNWISVDENGDYIASCSDDGKILVHGLYSSENCHSFLVQEKVKSIALDPIYYKLGSGRRFFTGDKKLVLHDKTFLNRLRSTVISECDSYVQMIAWKGRFVAWASKMGVRVFDVTAKVSLCLIQWESSNSVNVEDFRCNLLWSDSKTLMIGWVDTIRICIIRKRSHLEFVTRDTKEYLVDPLYTFQTDYYICGLGPLDNQLVILGLHKEKDSSGKSQRPILAIANYKSSEFTELSLETLNIKGFEDYNCNDYHLDMLIDENRFFIVSPKDIIISSPFDTEDTVQWLIKQGRYENAIQVLEEAGGKTNQYSVANVGFQYLDHMLSESNYEEAAKLCSKICKDNVGLWESQVQKFIQANQLRVLSQYLPTSNESKLNQTVYEMVLYDYLKSDSQMFLKLVKEWSPFLYRTSYTINATMEHLLRNAEDKNTYLEALAVLYTHEKKYDKALSMYLKLQHKDVFDLIERHNLYSHINDKVLDLVTLDCDKAIALFLNKKVQLPVDVVQKQLEEYDEVLLKYLDRYSKTYPQGNYHGKLVNLYAKYAKEKLLPFLKSSDNYPIQEALNTCTAHNLYKEMVFLLGRIGNTREALHIIIDKLSDINYAISFCQEQNDKDLWVDLIEKSAENPDYINLLIQRIGNYVDPRILIRIIKPGFKIPGLQESLVKMLSEYDLQLEVQDACKEITLNNYFELHQTLVKQNQLGIIVDDDFICPICKIKIILNDTSKNSDVVVFLCRHSFHIECLKNNYAATDQCIVCKN